MQIKQTMTAGVALAALVAMTSTGLAACSSPATSDQNLNKPGTSTDTLINAAATEPERSLIPADSSYSSGATYATLLFSGLSYLNPDGTIVNELATAVVPNPDCTEYDIQIRSGEVFSDGTKLKSDNFIRAWNDAARASNRRLKAGLFEPIEGFRYGEPRPDRPATPERHALQSPSDPTDLRFSAAFDRPGFRAATGFRI